MAVQLHCVIKKASVIGENFVFPLSEAYTAILLKSPLLLYLSDCTIVMIMSHCGISVIINIRLHDSQDELKTLKMLAIMKCI